jgi:diguanylate cyclase (GGDEF)-like protein
MDASKSFLELASQWGNVEGPVATVPPDECWAIRLGRTHMAGKNLAELACDHIKTAHENVTYFCVPLTAQNNVYGLLYLEFAGNETVTLSENEKTLVKALSELTALALANVRLRENLSYQSIRDPLTGLYNRRYLDEYLLKQVSQSERNKNPLAVLMIDIDHFKKINDNFGHDAGDFVLKELSRVLQGDIRTGDLVARYGGEEFIIVFYNTSLGVAKKRAEVIRQAVAAMQLKYAAENIGKITISIGVAIYPDDTKTVADLISCADKALYTAKNSGRDKIIAFSDHD